MSDISKKGFYIIEHYKDKMINAHGIEVIPLEVYEIKGKKYKFNSFVCISTEDFDFRDRDGIYERFLVKKNFVSSEDEIEIILVSVR